MPMTMKRGALSFLMLVSCRAVAVDDSASAALASLKYGKQFPGGPAGAVKAVTQLMRDWSMRLQTEGKNELASYDKYACWCEDTLARKAKDIADAKEAIDSLQTKIEKLMGETASHGAEIANLNKLISNNKKEQQDAKDTRSNENSEYEEDKTEAEQCIGALEAAIRALSGAGEGKGDFLQTMHMQEAQFLSVVGGVQKVLRKAYPSDRVSAKDLDFVRTVFDDPSRMYSNPRKSSMLAVDQAPNPFGDYAPQSTRIVGVLKGLYDAFSQDLEKANVEEADSQKSFEELMATKEAELETLQLTLENQEASEADKAKEKAEARKLRSDTQEQLKADEEFFAEAKAGCEAKAVAWGERVRLRTQEVQGIQKAIEILTDPKAVETFANSSAIAFVQLSDSVSRSRTWAVQWGELQNIARRSGSKMLAALIQRAKSGGYFDKVIASIDEMIALLRKEEKMDIAHKDRCENGKNDNKNAMEELGTSIDKAEKEMARMTREAEDAAIKVEKLELEIEKTKNDMSQALEMRNAESKQFIKSVKDDDAAVAILNKALDALVAFYERNKLPMLAQKGRQPREYTIDEDKAPETSFDSKGYGGAKSENEGVVAIMSMIIEDIEKEIQEAKKDDAAAEAEYEKGKAAMEETLLAQTETKASLEKMIQDTDGKIQEKQDSHDADNEDLAAQQQLTEALAGGCDTWDFGDRAKKRKAEMDGLQSAKSYLAGVASGTEIAP